MCSTEANATAITRGLQRGSSIVLMCKMKSFKMQTTARVVTYIEAALRLGSLKCTQFENYKPHFRLCILNRFVDRQQGLEGKGIRGHFTAFEFKICN